MILKVTYFTILAAIISTLALVVLTHIPSSYIPVNLRYEDKKLHFAAYSIVSFLYGLSFSPRGWKGIPCLVGVALFMCVLGAADEYSQQFFDRTTDIMDYYADLKGIALGIGAALIIWAIKTLLGVKIQICVSR